MLRLNFWREVFRLWFNSDADQYAASVAYFVPFALTPLILISMAVVGLIIGTNELIDLLASWGRVIDPTLPGLINESLSQFMLVTGQYPIPVLAVLFFSFMVVVAINSLTAGMHAILEIKTGGLKALFERYARAVVFIFVLQFYLLFQIFLANFTSSLVDGTGWTVFSILNPIMVLLSTIILFAIGYGILPLKAPSFRARLRGAAVAGILFFTLRVLVSLHFATTPAITLFGVATVIIVMLVWFYVGAGVVLFGVAVAKAYDNLITKKSPTAPPA